MRDLVRLSLAGLAAAALVVAVHAGASAQQGAPAKQAPPPAAQQPPAPPPLKQIALTEKQIESLLAAQKEIDAATDKLPEGSADKPDPKLEAQLEAIVKKNGFADMDEYGTVYDNVALVMSGIDPKTKAFTEPPEALKKQIAAVQADPKIPAKDKKAALADMNAALKTVSNVQFPQNVTIVTKYYDRLSEVMQDNE